MKMMRTKKYCQIAEIIMKAADEGEFLTQIEVWRRLPYTCAYGSLRKNLDVFEDRKLIMRERAGMVVLIKPMLLLYHWFR